MSAGAIMVWEDDLRCWEKIMEAGAAEVREACKHCQLLGCPKACDSTWIPLKTESMDHIQLE